MTDRTHLVPFFMILAISVTSMATDLYLPAMPIMVGFFDTSDDHIQNSISAYQIGMVFSALVYGPLSDAFGRRQILLTGFILFFISSLMLSACDNIDQLLMLRTIQGLAGGVSSALSPAIIRDKFSEAESNKIIAGMVMFILLTPAAAPIVGGYLTTYLGWRSCFFFIAASAFVSILLFAKFFPETHPMEARTKFHIVPIFNGYKEVLGNRSFLFYTLLHSLPSTAIFCHITTSPFVFINNMGVPADEFGYYVFGQIMIISATAYLVQRIAAKYSTTAVMLWGIKFYIIGSITASLGAYFMPESPMVAILSILPFFMGNPFVFPTSMSRAMSYAGTSKGSASASIASSRQLFAFAGSLAAAFLPHETMLPASLFICAISVLCLLSFLFAQRTERKFAHGTLA